jgi:hypothetical protein
MQQQLAAHVWSGPGEDAKLTSVLRASISKYDATNINALFSENTSFSQTGQLRHNCPNRNLIFWGAKWLFRYVENFQLGGVSLYNFEFEDL